MNVLSAFARRWSLFLGAVLLWEIATRVAGDVYFPPPTGILGAAAEMWFTGPAAQLFLTDVVYEHIVPSVGRALGGWTIAVLLGVGLGTVLGRSRTGMDYVGPLFAFSRAIPPPTLVPVFLVLFGIGTGMQLTTIVFGALWPILLNTVDGVRSVDRVKQDTARSFGTPRHYWVLGVVLPAASPKIFAGLRLSLSIALILMVVSEMVGAENGIGKELIFAQQRFDFPAMWAWIVLLGVLGYGLNALLLTVERRVLGWQQSRDQPTAKTTGA
ncbi:ABC-type nitrate/sulfonate/bicarbonate transport system, permease component [Amycolatopsis arida]|uniref:ABC-type nitrate/sulfonate/bicarbonate transport system, permease component n=1 Tax=Amycolatopsis arida TaxID=587909 RepID=A0A1I5QPX3_9PSEU|nr:ABC transporter permease [Amycolatopsis arida]TDX98922.1 ABC-type nitrate/sulfonate/bicarbonate transport system permease component [Amycolatopsis arida]SFP48358.1 ABC-type nitrate/sulfonate/bicarbonate transport system, permease component [Amycolatopsis arida]